MRATLPDLPIERRGNRGLLGHDVGTLRPILAGAVGPRMHFGDVADVAVPDDFAALAGARVGVSLVAHLRRHARSGGGFLQLLRFPDGASERLLTVDMFAASHGPHAQRWHACDRDRRPVRRRYSGSPCRTCDGNLCTSELWGRGCSWMRRSYRRDRRRRRCFRLCSRRCPNGLFRPLRWRRC